MPPTIELNIVSISSLAGNDFYMILLLFADYVILLRMANDI